MTRNQNIQQIVQRADNCIRRGRLTRFVLLAGVIFSLFVAPHTRYISVGNGILIAVCFIWVGLNIQAKRKANLTSTASQMIAMGEIGQAYGVLVEICRGFCLYKPVVLMACHNLAVILQKQRQWLAAWQLCELVRLWAGKKISEIHILSEAVRADCSLAMNNLAATHESLSVLSRLPLSVSERLSVLPTEINYCIQIGRGDAVMIDLPNKVALASLLPTEQAGKVHAWLALAAHMSKQKARRNWLWQRAALYCRAEDLLSGQPGLQAIAQAVNTASLQGCKAQKD